MTNYTTRKQLFQSMLLHLTFYSTFSLTFDGFHQIKSYEDSTTIFLQFDSDISNIKCKNCSKVITRNKGTRRAYPIIGKYNNKQVIGCFIKKIFKCNSCNSCTTQFTPDVQPNCQISNSIKTCIITDLSKANSTYTQTESDSFVSTTSVIRLFDSISDPLIDYSKYDTIGIDEIRFVKSAGNYQCTIFDAVSGMILEVLPNREAKTVKAYLKANFPHLKILSQDLWTTYKNSGKYANPDVKVIADMFHVVRTSMWSFNRGRVSHFKKNGNKANLRWRTYSFSMCKFDPIARAVVKHKIGKDEFMKKNHQAKEMFLAACKSETSGDFSRIYNSFERYVKKHNLTEYKSVLTMVNNWNKEIINAIESDISNGISERRNSDFKQAKRNARGFVNLPRAVKLVKYRINSKLDTNLYNVG